MFGTLAFSALDKALETAILCASPLWADCLHDGFVTGSDLSEDAAFRGNHSQSLAAAKWPIATSAEIYPSTLYGIRF
ncbi:hypothetical protein BN2475_240004 [Paraburkholderia ribeironis]|uniref:Uncharacterized protein n=1 Tax=Paraburkholderia ribeironis TaxID=1247936 RepID=A0A1N7RZ34_9BURK|nr:hypothetical protein BN2475_240004 [Paraburkholderia ribeironis]